MCGVYLCWFVDDVVCDEFVGVIECVFVGLVLCVVKYVEC